MNCQHVSMCGQSGVDLATRSSNEALRFVHLVTLHKLGTMRVRVPRTIGPKVATPYYPAAAKGARPE